ncbi:hypothetical protein ES332_D08G172000v1 [Gossypium tomentosum]|uniref:Uncharacterized protein n=1 Tax=Gossypium tomentosum TaxID=34277 RepID=A0A5D2JWI4_GOSTO|nr:hypothetical protein ES332_D08G172000v1 [Gossypium tomentosum]
MLQGLNPSVVFLVQTKLSVSRMAAVGEKCGFRNGINVNSNRRSGGLMLGWKETFRVFCKEIHRFGQFVRIWLFVFLLILGFQAVLDFRIWDFSKLFLLALQFYFIF